MTLDELKNKNSADINVYVGELREDLFKLKLQKGMGQLEKTHQLKQARRNIARALTVLNQKIKKEV